MTTYRKNQIQGFRFHDIDPDCQQIKVYGSPSQDKPTIVGTEDFIGWLFMTGRIDNYDPAGVGLVETKEGYSYDFEQFLSDTHVTGELDFLLADYFLADNGYQPTGVTHEINRSVPGLDDQANEWAYYYGLDDISHPNA